MLFYVLSNFHKKHFNITIFFFFHENYFYFLVFRDVPECSVFTPGKEADCEKLFLRKSFFIRVNTFNSIKLEMSMPN